jgi:hypothetical protein
MVKALQDGVERTATGEALHVEQQAPDLRSADGLHEQPL